MAELESLVAVIASQTFTIRITDTEDNASIVLSIDNNAFHLVPELSDIVSRVLSKAEEEWE